MPRIGVEKVRKRALIDAAIAAIHERGSLDVTVGQIARRAGVSSGLAHHYFGSKDQLVVSTMRHLLGELGCSVRQALAGVSGSRARLSAIVAANFAPEQFEPATVSAWLVFYVRAQESAEARRLLQIYARRLHTNLCHALRPLAGDATPAIAEGIGALIDGLYIRRALKDGPADPTSAIALVEDYVDGQLARAPSRRPR